MARLLNKLIADAYTTGASDIHIQPATTGKPANVLFRIDRVCKSIARISYKLVRPVVSRLKVMCAMDLAERRLPQDGKCTVKLRGQSLEIRVAVIPNSHGLAPIAEDAKYMCGPGCDACSHTGYQGRYSRATGRIASGQGIDCGRGFLARDC